MGPEEARAKYALGPDARDWQVRLAQQDLRRSGPSTSHLVPILYRPFDVRWTYYTGHSRGFHCMPRGEVMGHMLRTRNIGLSSTRNIGYCPSSPLMDFIRQGKQGFGLCQLIQELSGYPIGQ